MPPAPRIRETRIRGAPRTNSRPTTLKRPLSPIMKPNLSYLLALLSLTCLTCASSSRGSTTPATPEPATHRQTRSGTATDTAIRRAERFTQVKPESADAWVDLGNAWMQKSRDLANEVGYEPAEKAFRTALNRDAACLPAMLGLAWVCNTRHEFAEGCRWARQVIEHDPKQPDAYALLADAAVELGDYETAFEHLQVCLDLRPDLSSLSRSAHLLFLTGDLQRAQVLMRQAIKAGGPFPENTAWCQAQLAMMQFHSGALLVAERTIENARRLAPENPHVLAASGKIALARKQYSDAIQYLEGAAHSSHSHAALVDLESAYSLSGNADGVRETRKRIEAFHQEDHAHETQAHSHQDNSEHSHSHSHSHGEGNADWARYLADHDRDLDEALRQAEGAYRTFKNIHVTDTLAWCYYKKGRYEEAQKTIRKALKWKTPDATLLFHAGMIHAKIGDLPTARRFLYQAMSLNPNFHPTFATQAAETLASLAGKNSTDPLKTTASLRN